MTSLLSPRQDFDNLDPEAVEALSIVGSIPSPLRTFTIDDLADLPEPSWLVHGVLPDSSLSVLYGLSGIGKSFLALDWSLCISTGKSWNGRPVTQGKVIYIAGEGVRGLYKRINAWMQANPDVDRDTVRENFIVVPKAVSLLREEDAASLLTTVALHENVVLVVVDTLARSLTGGDENSAKDVGLSVRVLDEVKMRTGAGCLVIHHTGKQGDVERGSGALRGAADAMLLVKPQSPGLALICDKAKDAVPFGQMQFSLTQVGESAVLSQTNSVNVHGAPPSSYGRTQAAPFVREGNPWF